MQVRLLLGPAGSGKTFRCLGEARQALCSSPEGLPMVLIAPRQGTYQLEQQLLGTTEVAGFTRLSILSFDSMARQVFGYFNRACPELLNEQGRLMVLRAVLARTRDRLRVFRASARLTGFAQQLSVTLGEVQRARLAPSTLRELAATWPPLEGLALKLQDLASLLEHYQDWLGSHELQDEDSLLESAAELLRTGPDPGFRLESLWVDGFAEFSDLELELLCALLPYCNRATVTFCLESAPSPKGSWLSHWSIISRNFELCRKRLAALGQVEVVVQSLPREPGGNRFCKSPALQHLEAHWAAPAPFEVAAAGQTVASVADAPVKLVGCADREAEVILAAREILTFVRAGARYREVSLLVRRLDPYYQLIQRVFADYQIPFFLDQRESVAHHPLAELTRSAVRLVAFGWQQEDWFAALKSGLVPAAAGDIDLLENEALARGWKGDLWHHPIQLSEAPRHPQDRARLQDLQNRLEKVRRQVVPPFERLTLALARSRNQPTGVELAEALRELWGSLDVEYQLQSLAAGQRDPASDPGSSAHQTVWRQMKAWLDNAELAFPVEAIPLREWVPVLESALGNLTIGIIPPALDQVLVGAVDRSRTPEVKLALVLGLNESVFPAAPEPGGLLSESDRVELEQRQVALGVSARRHLGRERYLAYIAFTRARQKLVVTWSGQDTAGSPLIASSLVSRLNELFPHVPVESAADRPDWRQAQHPIELAPVLVNAWIAERRRTTQTEAPRDPNRLELSSVFASFPALGPLLANLRQLAPQSRPEELSPDLAARLYGPVLRSSVSRLEHFGCCPFRFFIYSGLRAEERRLFELDTREQGTFQHDVLALFHEKLRSEGKRWREITPGQARELAGQIAQNLAGSFRNGLLQADEQARFAARVMTASLQDFVETMVGWMQQQYRFDPVAVELPFGEDGAGPAWCLDLGNGKQLALRGRIDRLDLCRVPQTDRVLCVVIDYKSSRKQLDPLLVAHGLQLQLLTYLNVVRDWPNPGEAFGAAHLQPAGVFYVSLRGRYESEPSRVQALAEPDRARKLAYRHAGRFDYGALPYLDARPDAVEGDQFNYRFVKSGQVDRRCKEVLATADFETLLQQVTASLRTVGQRVYAGQVTVDPYRLGTQTACDQCGYQAICRIDRWSHVFRVLRREGNPHSPRDTASASPTRT